MDKLGRQFKTACTVQENIEMTERFLIRSDSNMSFGFGYRRLPNDFFICEVNDNSPASDACLQKGDRILFINDKSVNDLNFDESIKLIVSSPHELKLTVKYEIERFKECWNLLTTYGDSFDVYYDNEDDYGFKFREVNGDLFICEVNSNSPASRAHLEVGYRILRINGDNVVGYDSTHLNIFDKMKSRPNHIELECNTDKSVFNGLKTPNDSEVEAEIGNTSNAQETTEFPTCVICFEKLGSGTVTTLCGHCFHSNCLDEWSITSNTADKLKCPYCNRMVDRDQCRQIFWN